MKLKAYYLPYADGNNHLLVAAQNQREACRLFNCSVGYFRRLGGQVVGGLTAGVALSEPGKVWKQWAADSFPHPWVLK